MQNASVDSRTSQDAPIFMIVEKERLDETGRDGRSLIAHDGQ